MWMQLPIFRFPLSGDVNQVINPFSWFVRTAGQIGLVNIQLGSTPNPQLEQDIVEDVGSYGRQIGRLADAVEVLIGTLDFDRLSKEQKDAVAAFRPQAAAVRAMKARHKHAPEPVLSEPPARLLDGAVPEPARSS